MDVRELREPVSRFAYEFLDARREALEFFGAVLGLRSPAGIRR
jgi:hypothetical protein